MRLLILLQQHQYLLLVFLAKYSLNLEKILSFPFVILIVGAIITGLLFLFLTNRWQSRRKDLELQFQLKLDLLKRIKESVIQTVMNSLSAWRSCVRLTGDDIIRVHRESKISAAEIESYRGILS